MLAATARIRVGFYQTKSHADTKNASGHLRFLRNKTLRRAESRRRRKSKMERRLQATDAGARDAELS